jgi:radical SAM-linked protein
MRTFTRAFRRSSTPIYYTEGFTKRPLLVFPYPLSLGVGGENEILDIKTYVEFDDVNDYMKRLNSVLADGIEVRKILSGDFPQDSYAVYDIELPDAITFETLQRFLAQDFIKATKFSKKRGDITFDLKPLLRSVELISEKNLKVILPVGEVSNVNVNVFIKAFSDFCKLNPNEFYAKRIEFLP